MLCCSCGYSWPLSNAGTVGNLLLILTLGRVCELLPRMRVLQLVFGAFLCSLISTNPSDKGQKAELFVYFFPLVRKMLSQTQSLIIGGKVT